MRSAPHAAPRAVVLPRIPPDFGLIALVLIVLGVSGGLLWSFGINYDGLSGSAPHKVHPATYLGVALFGLAMVRAGNPVAHLVRSAERRPAAILIAVSGLVLLLHIVLRGAPGMAGSLDTFLLPGLVAILLADADEAAFRRMETVLHGVMLANALLGLVEFVTGQRFFPYRFDGAVFEMDTRSAALQGHPLGNATLTACYVLALLAGGGTLSPLWRAVIVGIQLAALVTFGGRSAMVVTCLLGGARCLVLLHRAMARGRIPLLAAASAAFALPLMAVAVAGLAYGGFFDALLSRFASDGGSANARVEMFALFAKIPLRDLVFGPDAAFVDSLRRISGLEWGIENPLVRSLLYQGAAMTALLTVAVVLFLWEVARHCRRGVALPMLAFAILVNTFESLGGKTTLLAKFAILLLVLYHPAAPGDRGRRRMPGRR